MLTLPSYCRRRSCAACQAQLTGAGPEAACAGKRHPAAAGAPDKELLEAGVEMICPRMAALLFCTRTALIPPRHLFSVYPPACSKVPANLKGGQTSTPIAIAAMSSAAGPPEAPIVHRAGARLGLHDAAGSAAAARVCTAPPRPQAERVLCVIRRRAKHTPAKP